MATSDREHSEPEFDDTPVEPEDFDPTAAPAWDLEHSGEEFTGDEEPGAAGQAGDEELGQPATELDQPPDEHPDNYAWLDLPEEQRNAKMQELAQSDPGLLARGLLRDKDYREKTTEAAREREALEAQREELRRAPPTPEAEPEVPAERAAWAEDFFRRTGRQATEADYIDEQLDRKLDQRMKPMETRQMERDATQTQTMLEAEYQELGKEYPEATAPEVGQAIASRVVEMAKAGVPIKPGTVRELYWALYGPKLVEQARQGATQARQKQATGRKTTPSPPVGPGAGRAKLPETSDVDVLAERFRQKHAAELE